MRCANRVALDALWGDVGWLEAALAASLSCVALALLGRLRGAPAPGLWTLRAAVYLAVLGAVACLAWLQPYRRLVVELLAGALGGVFAALVLASGPLARLPRRLRSSADLVLLNASVLAVAGRAGAARLGAHSTSPLFAPDDAGAVAMIERWRPVPGAVDARLPDQLAALHGRRVRDRRAGQAGGGGPSATASRPASCRCGSTSRPWPSVTCRGPLRQHRRLGHRPARVRAPAADRGPAPDPSVVVVDIFIGNDLTAPLDEPDAAASRPRCARGSIATACCCCACRACCSAPTRAPACPRTRASSRARPRWSASIPGSRTRCRNCRA